MAAFRDFLLIADFCSSSTPCQIGAVTHAPISPAAILVHVAHLHSSRRRHLSSISSK